MTHEKQLSSGTRNATTATQIFDTVEGQVERIQSGFNEGYREGYENGSSDTCAYEWGSGSKSAKSQRRDRDEAWEQSDCSASLPTVTDAKKEEDSRVAVGEGVRYLGAKKTLEEPRDVETNTVQGPMELQESVRDLLRYINDTPRLLSLLYDIDMMPEQLKEGTNQWLRMLMIADCFRDITPPILPGRVTCVCPVCGWQDGIREDFLGVKGVTWCDRCNEQRDLVPSGPEQSKSSSGSGFPKIDLDLEASATLKVPEMAENSGIKEAERATIHVLQAPRHAATRDLVQRFADALGDKLARAEEKYGFGDGWLSPDWMDECRERLREHIEKGDPRDVAAYCAFLWHHGEATNTPPECWECAGKNGEHYEGCKQAPSAEPQQPKSKDSEGKESERVDTVKGQTGLLGVVKAAYLKHHCGLDNVGWEQLSNMMCDALCNAMGDTEFQRWLEENVR